MYINKIYLLLIINQCAYDFCFEMYIFLLLYHCTLEKLETSDMMRCSIENDNVKTWNYSTPTGTSKAIQFKMKYCYANINYTNSN